MAIDEKKFLADQKWKADLLIKTHGDTKVAGNPISSPFSEDWRFDDGYDDIESHRGQPVFGVEEGGQTYFEFPFVKIRGDQKNDLKIAHGTHVKEPDFQLPDGRDYYKDPKHNWQDHIGVDPSGKPIMYRDVHLYNEEGGLLPITRDNEGMIRKEYHQLNDSMHLLFGLPDTKAGKAQYQKMKEKYGWEY